MILHERVFGVKPKKTETCRALLIRAHAISHAGRHDGRHDGNEIEVSDNPPLEQGMNVEGEANGVRPTRMRAYVR
jgi:hypothetical protein